VNITERKRLRREIRSTLGTSRDVAPDMVQLLRSAKDLDRALELTPSSSGRYTALGVFDSKTGEYVSTVEALGQERAERRDANARLNAIHTGTYKAGE
jgi:hypothetical protein